MGRVVGREGWIRKVYHQVRRVCWALRLPTVAQGTRLGQGTPSICTRGRRGRRPSRIPRQNIREAESGDVAFVPAACPSTSYFSPPPRLLHLLHSFSYPKLCSIRESIQQIDSERILEKPRYRYTCWAALVPKAGQTGRQPSKGFHEASVPTCTKGGGHSNWATGIHCVLCDL